MKLKAYFRAVLPTPATTIFLVMLPMLLGIYFLIVGYSDNAVSSGLAGEVDINKNVLLKVLFGLPWAQWLNRFGDFIFWGVLAAIGLIAFWLLSSARFSWGNHVAEQSFRNFRISKSSWHGHFIVAISAEVGLVAIFLYLLAVLLAQSIPNLARSVSDAIVMTTSGSLVHILERAFVIVCLQFGMIVAIKTLKGIQVE